MIVKVLTLDTVCVCGKFGGTVSLAGALSLCLSSIAIKLNR